jgi:uncharacterized protein
MPSAAEASSEPRTASLGFDRIHTIGTAALVSAAADITKTVVFAKGGLVNTGSLPLALAAIPLMFVATLAGRHFSQVIGERGYARLFWLVIGAYAARLLLIR